MLSLFKRDYIQELKDHFSDCNDIIFETIYHPETSSKERYFVLIYQENTCLDNIKSVLLEALNNKIYHLDETKLHGIKEISLKNLDLIEKKIFSMEVLVYDTLTGIMSSIPTFKEVKTINEVSLNIKYNTLQLRNVIRTPKLKIKSYDIGESTKTNVRLIYQEELVNEEIQNDIHKSLKRCTLSSVMSMDDLHNIASGCNRSFLPVFGQTTNLNLIKKELDKGHFVIFMDGQEKALIGPYNLFGLLGLSLNNYPYLFIERIIKVIAIFIGLFLSGLVASLYLYHPSLMPYSLLSNINIQDNLVLNLSIQFIIIEVILLLIKLLNQFTKSYLTIIIGALSLISLLYTNFINADILLFSLISFISINLLSIEKKLNEAFYIIHLIVLILSLILGMLGFAFSVIFTIIFISSKKVFNQTYLYPLSPLDFSSLWNYLKGKIVK